MSLLRLDITDFRNLGSAKMDTMPNGFNFIYGANGSGKTSLLEAVYYLSRGRSFRSSSVNYIINNSNSADKFSIFAQMQTQGQQVVPIGMERQRDGGINIRISGEDGSFAELVELTPSLLINSTS